MEDNENIKIAGRLVGKGLEDWADVCVCLDESGGAFFLGYTPRDLMNATYIFQHIVSNIGIKSGHINNKNAVDFGKRLRLLILEETGYDPSILIEQIE